MPVKTYLRVSSFIFAVVGLAHIVRAFKDWDITIGAWSVPMWVSFAGAIVLLFLSLQGFQHSK